MLNRSVTKLVALLVFLASAGSALAQSVPLQGGPWVGGHVPMYAGTGNAQPVIQDAGGASGGAISTTIGEMGLTVRGAGSPPYANGGTGPNGENFCDYDAPVTNSTGYHVLCFSPNAQGGGLISYGTGGGAAPLPLQFLVNGQIQTPATASGYTPGALLCYSTVSNSIVPCPIQPGTMYSQNANSVAISGGTVSGTTITGGTIGGGAVISGLGSVLGTSDGGTGVNSYSALRTALGLGTMALQNASGVAITGGTITGMPSPSIGSDVANKAYVDSIATGLIPLAASNFITVAALPANTYSNGASGVGATLTATGNGALSVDGVAVSAANVVIVNNEVATANNGIYTVTATGDGSNPYVLTRATYFNTAAKMLKNSYSAVTAGATETGTSWILAATVTTVGTTPVSFTLFQSSPLTSLSNGTIFVGNSSNVATSRTVSGDGTLSNTGVLAVTKTGGVAFAASATTDTTVATNISSGTLPAARLPNPSASTLGGIQSKVAVSNQFLTSISTSGVPASAQPAFTDVSGTATAAQGGTGQSSYTSGDMLYASGTTALSKVGIGSTGQVLTVTGGFPVWSTPASASSSVVLNAQSGNYTLLAADNSKLVQFTGSSDATFAFTAAATLGSGWFTYIQNNGTANATVTLDPNGGETIDGITSFKMYPNEVRLVQTNGVGFNSVVLTPFGMTLTSTITFTAPPGYIGVRGTMWGGGGGGSGNSGAGGGGGGGSGGPFDILMSALASPGATVTLTVGAGGAAQTVGGNSSLGAAITYYGGGGATTSAGGGGGGSSAVGGGASGTTGGTGGAAVNGGGGGAASANGTLPGGGGGGGSSTVAGGFGNLYGGGGGAGQAGGNAGGSSVWGGGGGGARTASNNGGKSLYGGNGGDGNASITGSVPGGGGGAGPGNSSTGGLGARGEIRIAGY